MDQRPAEIQSEEEYKLFLFIQNELKMGIREKELKEVLLNTAWAPSKIIMLINLAKKGSSLPQEGSQTLLLRKDFLIINENGDSKLESDMVEGVAQQVIEEPQIRMVSTPLSPDVIAQGDIIKTARWEEFLLLLDNIQIFIIKNLSRVSLLILLLFHCWRLSKKFRN